MVDTNFFHYTQRVFKICQIWSHDHREKRTLMKRFLKIMVFIFTAVSITMVSLLDTIEAIKHGEPTIIFSKALYFFGIIAAAQKLFTASFNDDEIWACIEQLEDLSKRFKDTSDIEKCLRLYDRLFVVGTSFISICGVIFVMTPLTTDVKKPLILSPHVKCLNLEATPNWQLFYIYEIVVLSILTITMTSLDMLFCGMMYVCSGILSSICREIRELDDIIEDYQRLDNKMKETIEKLNDITQLTTRISDTFSTSAMVHIIYNCISIALTLYLNKALPFGPLFFSMIMVFIYISFQLWIYCYFGQNLVIQRELLRRELYFTRWYDGSKNFKTMLLLTIFEMQNDRYVYAEKIVPLSLETFTMVIKRTYTVFTFLTESR